MRTSPVTGGIVFALILVLAACKKPIPELPGDAAIDPGEYLLSVPKGFDSIPFPADNPFSLEKWELGKKMFFDPRFSKDNRVSCASCHKPQHAFADIRETTPGAFDANGTRNVPSLANVAYFKSYTREAGVPTLEMQVLVPIQEHNELNSNILEIAEKLNEDSSYVKMSLEAFGRKPDAWVITRSLATFERTLVSGNSKYDQYLRGAADLSDIEKTGMALFFSSRTQCSSCHSGILFTNGTTENNGIYDQYTDPGRFRLTLDSADIGKFKVPSLRNVAITAPYMHDGSFPTLKSVIEHYNTGGKNHFNQSSLVKPLHLNDTEMEAIIAFLGTLTDQSFIQNPAFNETVE
ncbi:MAG: cytochrome-c peroxidase [Salibacteraceae bacterium]